MPSFPHSHAAARVRPRRPVFSPGERTYALRCDGVGTVVARIPPDGGGRGEIDYIPASSGLHVRMTCAHEAKRGERPPHDPLHESLVIDGQQRPQHTVVGISYANMSGA